jgi:hypothetical protein
MGYVYKRGNIYWLKYYRHGKPYRESSKSEKITKAQKLLKKREGEIAEGKLPGIYFDKVTFNQLAEDFLTDYRINGKDTLSKAERLVKYLKEFFGGMKATEITTDKVKTYIEKGMEDEMSNASINRELAALKRRELLTLQSSKRGIYSTSRDQYSWYDKKSQWKIPLEDNEISSTKLTPWEEASYQLISWWDIMKQFTFGRLYKIGSSLERAKFQYLPPVERGNFVILSQKETMTEQDKSDLITFLQYIEDECKRSGLRYSAQAANEFKKEMSNIDIKKFNTITANRIAARLEEVDHSIEREMKLHLFMYIPPDRAEYCQSWGENERAEQGGEIPLFGNAVKDKFPSVDYDVNEAGNSFAVARYTGCVFHLMRILEVGLRELAKRFNVPADHSNWNPIIENIERKIKEIRNDPNKPPNWKEDEEFYSQAASHFRVFKDAWRNYTMHARGKYTEDEAEIIMMNVRAFMQKLTTRISELK